jgi:hypothetical protein
MTTIRCSAAATVVAGALALGMLVLGARAFGASDSPSAMTREERDDLIAYGFGGGEDRHVIRTIRSDGTGDRRLIGPTRMRFFRGPSRPEWSRDGSKLLFGGHLHLDTEAQTLWYSNASGRRVTRVPLGLGEGLEGQRAPALHGWDWAPGGRRVVVAAGTRPLAPPRARFERGLL